MPFENVAARAKPSLRTRLCEEKNGAGLTAMRASMERWAKEHPDGQAAVANALVDYNMAKCVKPVAERTP